jgi:hypothetical protein
MEIIQRFAELDEQQMRQVVDATKNSAKLDDRTRTEIMSFGIMMLAQTNPEAGLRLVLEAKGLSTDSGIVAAAVATSLKSIAHENPDAALAWLKNPAHGTIVHKELRAQVLAKIAEKNLSMAVAEISADKDPETFYKVLGRQLKSSQWQELMTLAGAHENGSLLRKHVLSGITKQLAEGTPAAAESWLATATLSETEREEFISQLGEQNFAREPGKWLDILSKQSDPAKVQRSVSRFMETWTRNDFNAAGDWIKTQPHGDLRREATISFVDTLAPHEPTAAATWALTLPADEKRTELLNKIHDAWKAKDSSAAEAFRQQHGLE